MPTDHFYASLHSDREQKKRTSQKLFLQKHPLFVSLHGHAIFMNQKGECIAFAYGFSITGSKNWTLKHLILMIFTSTDNHLEGKLKEELHSIENILNGSREYFYLLAIR